MAAGRARISVCVCTFRRPLLLERLLQRVKEQRLDPNLEIDVVVVDNDRDRSAESIVRKYEEATTLPVTYVCEPVQNIALARNAAVRAAGGELIAFLDDDEWPVENWLVTMFDTMARTGSDGALGPVVPEYPAGAPAWLGKADVFDRRRPATGTTVTHRDARTGNLLLRKALIAEDGEWFDPAFGTTGGEDSDFFGRQLARGRTFVWCNEAVAFETVVPERWGVGFHLKRQWRSGAISGSRMRRRAESEGLAVLREAAFLVGGLALSGPALLLPRHIAVHVWLKTAYSLGFLGAFVGVWRPARRD